MEKIKIVYVVLVILIVSFFLGCVAEEMPPATPAPTTPMVTATPMVTEIPELADGKILYNYIMNVSNYKKWKMWPGKDEFYPKSPGPAHGDLLTTYVSDNAYDTITGGKGTMPEDAIIVKENYHANKTLDSLTVMLKEEGYDPTHNDWFWAKYAPDGTIQAEGKVEGCYECHELRKDNDYIYTTTP